MRVDASVASRMEEERKEQEAYKHGEGWFDEGGDPLCQLGDIHAFLIPPKGTKGCRNWKSRSQKRWVKRVLVVNSIQLLLTWLLFFACISHYRLQRMTSTTCAAVVTDELSGESSIATTCEGAVLVNESVIELKDPLYEAALNYTDLVESGAVDANSQQWSSDPDYMTAAQVVVLECFLFVFLLQKMMTSWKLVYSSNIKSMDPPQRHYDLVYCGAILSFFCMSQLFANLSISLVARGSGVSLFTAIFATFTLLIVADLDSKLLAAFMPPKRKSEAESQEDTADPRLGVEISFPFRKALKGEKKAKRHLIITFTGLISFLLLMAFAAASAVLAGAILLAVNGLRYSEFTARAVSMGTDYSEYTDHL